MCALPANAVLASAGEMHELAHQDYLHAHAGDAHLASAEHAGGDAADEGRSFLHVLMHASHCCVSPPAIVPDGTLRVPGTASAVLHRHFGVLAPRRLVSTLFRPPIAG